MQCIKKFKMSQFFNCTASMFLHSFGFLSTFHISQNDYLFSLTSHSLDITYNIMSNSPWQGWGYPYAQYLHAVLDLDCSGRYEHKVDNYTLPLVILEVLQEMTGWLDQNVVYLYVLLIAVENCYCMNTWGTVEVWLFLVDWVQH